MKDFFISYTARDRQWAEWIAWELEEAGYSVQIQAWDFVGNWVLLMNDAMRETTRTIAVLSPNFFDSRYTASEWANAFRLDPTGEKDLLIPVRVAEVELSGIFAQLTYVDLVGVPEEEASERLLKRVRGERGKPSKKPAFPVASQASRTIVTKPAYPAYEEDVQRVGRARQLLLRWRSLYKDQEAALRDAAGKAHEWRFALPAALSDDVIDVLRLAGRVAEALAQLPVRELEFANPYGLLVHPTVFSGLACGFADRAADSRIVPNAYAFEMIERVLNSAVAVLCFRLDALPLGYIDSIGVARSLKGFRTLLVARIDQDPALHLLALDGAPTDLGTFGARKLSLFPLCARRNSEGKLDLAAEDDEYLYVWTGGEAHPSAQYARPHSILAASFLPDGTVVAADAEGTIRFLAGGEEGPPIRTRVASKASLIWCDPTTPREPRVVSLTGDFALLSSGRDGTSSLPAEKLWHRSRFWTSVASLVPGTVDGFPCVVVHRSMGGGEEGVYFVDPVSLQSIRPPVIVEEPITSMTLAAGRWLVLFLLHELQRIAVIDLAGGSAPVPVPFYRGGEVYESVVIGEGRDGFEILFVLSQYSLYKRILCRWRGPSGDVEELATYSDLRILPVKS